MAGLAGDSLNFYLMKVLNYVLETNGVTKQIFYNEEERIPLKVKLGVFLPVFVQRNMFCLIGLSAKYFEWKTPLPTAKTLCFRQKSQEESVYVLTLPLRPSLMG